MTRPVEKHMISDIRQRLSARLQKQHPAHSKLAGALAFVRPEGVPQL